ncbi:hypothetical protein FB45DRAFT_1090613 [Roridomyces roridus]|uniref:Uncharacterized protein n=1 Tax=Roridomyces roridus TaxID=1738132 RepID=A0AAD7BIJ3_9AGAR|nr:hypothetical protein FB45DRAFT_1090613 [Roridomyces roridus]
MDEQTHLDSAIMKIATEGAASGSPTFAGAFFPQAQNVHVAGGTFTSRVDIHQPMSSQPFRDGRRGYPTDILNPDFLEFKQIARWEIDLLREISLGPGVPVTRSGGTRRMFSAKIHNTESEKAVVLYEGEKAQEYVVSVVFTNSDGIAIRTYFKSSGVQFLPQMCFQGEVDLLPYKDYLTLRRPSFMQEVYLRGCWNTEPFVPSTVAPPRFTIWVRRSSGALCLEMESSSGYISAPSLFPDWHNLEDARLKPHGALVQLDRNDPTWDATAIECFAIAELHQTVSGNLRKGRFFWARRAQIPRTNSI